MTAHEEASRLTQVFIRVSGQCSLPAQVAAAYRFFWGSIASLLSAGTEEERREVFAELELHAESAPELVKRAFLEFDATTGRLKGVEP